ncbi:MAG: DUF1638 domain-containing protein [Anaerolineae bacterium]
MADNQKPVVILACRVMQSLIEPHLRDDEPIPTTYMDYGLHIWPEKMTPALQSQLDALPQPSLVLIGYGLCGNGLNGLKAGPHTLIIPRADDCITILLGSYQAYIRAFREEPGTYYLTKGWLESGSDPLKEYRQYVARYGEENADALIDIMYRRYKRLCFVAHTQADLDEYRPQAMEVAQFCARRWGMTYEERLGSDGLIRRLLEAGRRAEDLGDDFIVVPPGGTVAQKMFIRELDARQGLR